MTKSFNAAASTEAGPRPVRDFPIVGIGCSAGGLEALETLLRNVPPSCGMAFVIVQHLDPGHVSQLSALLQRVTPMVVSEAGNGMPVKPDCVYVIPPNKDLSLRHGTLHLLEPTERRGLRLPIDFFMRTLADDRQEKAIGIVLSGMGSDGMLGLGAIKEKFGLTLAQKPASAKAEGMPRSAIAAGVVDIITLPEELPRRIVDYLKRVPASPLPAPVAESSDQNALDRIIALLGNRSGNDFSLYKPSGLYRRIERRIALLQIAGIADYADYLSENPQELDLLFRELLIGVTTFFRDPAVWDFLASVWLPALFARYPDGKALRAWVPACSSGDEAYSLAIVFREAIEKSKPAGRFSLQIYATDLDVDAVDKARKGFYPGNIEADVSPQRLACHFVAENGGYRVNRDIREMVIFAPQNIVSDPPFTKLDILSCRNLLIYFGSELQKKLFPLFHYALLPDGILLLGCSESLGNFGEIFEAVDNKKRIFQRTDRNQPVARPSFLGRPPSGASTATQSKRPDYRESIEYLTDQLIQQNYSPAAVLVNADGDILYISGRTGKYLEPAAGKVNINIHAMAREGLREALTGIIRNALHHPLRPIHLNDLEIKTGSGTQSVNITVQAIATPNALHKRVLIVFTDVAKPPLGKTFRKSAASEREKTLTHDLRQTREALRLTHEEMQDSLEEVKSAIEELQATNEELTTSKEELQSMNEELQTVNAELQSKVDDLTWARNDMTNLLNSTEIATIFLDRKMKLRRYTTYATHLFKLIPGDIGRSLSDIVTDLDYKQLTGDAEDVLSSLIFRECQASTHDGRWYRVRIMPYRTQDNVIDGVVVTFIDITEIKALEAKLLRHEAMAADSRPAAA